jgi:hypothetical protein
MAASHRFNGFLGWPLRQPIVKGKIANDTELSNPLILLTAPSIDWSGREDLNLRPPGPELGGMELILLLFNHLSGASTVSFLLDHASLGVM